jgi:hypothetical protein
MTKRTILILGFSVVINGGALAQPYQDDQGLPPRAVDIKF